MHRPWSTMVDAWLCTRTITQRDCSAGPVARTCHDVMQVCQSGSIPISKGGPSSGWKISINAMDVAASGVTTVASHLNL